METSDDESAEDETCKMSPMPTPKNSNEDDEGSDSDGGHEAVEEEEGRV
jgi:hypothetical protein